MQVYFCYLPLQKHKLSFCLRFVCGADWRHIIRSPFFGTHITQVRFSIQSSTRATVKPTVIHCTLDPKKKLTFRHFLSWSVHAILNSLQFHFLFLFLAVCLVRHICDVRRRWLPLWLQLMVLVYSFHQTSSGNLNFSLYLEKKNSFSRPDAA